MTDKKSCNNQPQKPLQQGRFVRDTGTYVPGPNNDQQRVQKNTQPNRLTIPNESGKPRKTSD